MGEELSPEVIAIRAKRAAKLTAGPVAESLPTPKPKIAAKPMPKRPEPKPKAVVKAKKKSK